MEEHERTLLRWLEAHGPGDWHQVAIDWNWDAGLDILAWIAEQPRCDRATAQYLIFGGDPAAFRGVSGREELMVEQPYDLEPFDLLSTVIGNWNDGFYSRSEIATYDPTALKRSERRCRLITESGEIMPWKLAPDMFRILNGQEFCYRYAEGWPPEVTAELHARGIDF